MWCLITAGYCFKTVSVFVKLLLGLPQDIVSKPLPHLKGDRVSICVAVESLPATKCGIG